MLINDKLNIYNYLLEVLNNEYWLKMKMNKGAENLEKMKILHTNRWSYCNEMNSQFEFQF